MVKTLQEITDAWGNWSANQWGTNGVWFTASTDYSNSQLGNHQKYKTVAKYLATVYGDNTKSGVAHPAFGEEIWDDNGTNLEQTDVLHCSCATKDSLTWSITEGLKIGVEISAEMKVPEVASIGAKLSTEMSLSTTQSRTSSEDRSWGLDVNVKTPPKRSVGVQAIVTVQAYDLPFTSTVSLDGYVAVWYNKRIDWNHDGDYHQLWFIPITEVIQDAITHNIISTEGYTILGSQVIVSATGVVTGDVGISVDVKRQETDLRGGGSTFKSARPAKRSGEFLTFVFAIECY
ncbi:hypothetical protein M422DRAFT_263400 [Sphaerobolus stellatus SS14]|uniref:Cytotoxin n=1 Tax=Sphaerobolus stellatus (strain SS14) TaxID=990650 RepID=A0A0C9VAF7_SPHS4|nr:hypothetical protein M422DRAFT_263400 [Sphaerobolus stellatus SS14]